MAQALLRARSCNVYELPPLSASSLLPTQRLLRRLSEPIYSVTVSTVCKSFTSGNSGGGAGARRSSSPHLHQPAPPSSDAATVHAAVAATTAVAAPVATSFEEAAVWALEDLLAPPPQQQQPKQQQQQEPAPQQQPADVISGLAAATAVVASWSAGELQPPPDEAAWQALERHTRPLLPDARPEEAAALLAAVVAAGRQPSAAWLNAAQAALVAGAEAAAAAAATATDSTSSSNSPAAAAAAAAAAAHVWAGALTALARCGGGGAALDRRAGQALLAATTPGLATLPPPELARLLTCAAKARLLPSAAWLAAARGALPAAAPQLAAPQLAACLRALAQLAERIEAAELRPAAAPLAAELAARPAGCTPGALAQSLWALAKLGFVLRGGGTVGGVAVGMASTASEDDGDGGGKGAAGPVVAATLLAHVSAQLPRLAPGELSGLLWALARLGFAADSASQGAGDDGRVPPALVAAFASEAAAQMPAMSNAAWVQAVWGLAKLVSAPGLPTQPTASPSPSPAPAPPLPREFGDELWRQAHLRSGRLTAGESAALLWAVARLGLEPPPRWLAAELAASAGALARCGPDQLASTVAALARIGRRPPPAWLEAFEAACLSGAAGGLGSFTLPELTATLWALHVGLGHCPCLEWQNACVTALRAKCAVACGARAPLAASAVGALLAEAGLLGALRDAVDAQAAADEDGCCGGGDAAAAAAQGPGECPVAFELPLGCV